MKNQGDNTDPLGEKLENIIADKSGAVSDNELNALLALFQTELEAHTKAACERAGLEAQKKTIDEVYTLAPDKLFKLWKPTDVYNFFARLKEYEKGLEAQLSRIEGEV